MKLKDIQKINIKSMNIFAAVSRFLNKIHYWQLRWLKKAVIVFYSFSGWLVGKNNKCLMNADLGGRCGYLYFKNVGGFFCLFIIVF